MAAPRQLPAHTYQNKPHDENEAVTAVIADHAKLKERIADQDVTITDINEKLSMQLELQHQLPQKQISQQQLP